MLNFKNKIGILILSVALLVYSAIEAQGSGDFFIFMSAAGDLEKGLDIYAKNYLFDYHYYYSVLFALFLKCFYRLPFFAVKFSWLLLNAFLFFHLVTLLLKSSFVKELPAKQQKLLLYLASLFAFRFVHENLHSSQITILILWCAIYGLYRIRRNQTISGSTLLAIGINIKLLPLVILPYLIYRGYLKAFVLTLGIYVLTLLAPSVIIGPGYNLRLLSSWWQLVNPSNANHVLDVDERSFHSLTTLLSVLMVENVPDYYALPLKRNIADVSLQTLSTIILFVRLILIGFTLYFLKLKFLKRANSTFEQCVEISYILLLVPLVFPHQQHYAFLFIVPAYTIVLYYLIKKWDTIKNRKVWIAMMTVIYLCANLKLLLGEFNRYYEHYKILSYGALLLIPMLIALTKHIKQHPHAH